MDFWRLPIPGGDTLLEPVSVPSPGPKCADEFGPGQLLTSIKERKLDGTEGATEAATAFGGYWSDRVDSKDVTTDSGRKQGSPATSSKADSSGQKGYGLGLHSQGLASKGAQASKGGSSSYGSKAGAAYGSKRGSSKGGGAVSSGAGIVKGSGSVDIGSYPTYGTGGWRQKRGWVDIPVEVPKRPQAPALTPDLARKQEAEVRKLEVRDKLRQAVSADELRTAIAAASALGLTDEVKTGEKKLAKLLDER